jgi:hypothetical protein
MTAIRQTLQVETEMHKLRTSETSAQREAIPWENKFEMRRRRKKGDVPSTYFNEIVSVQKHSGGGGLWFNGYGDGKQICWDRGRLYLNSETAEREFEIRISIQLVDG